MGTREASGTQSRTERADFQATADPALNKAADRTADVKLLTYAELYDLWERKQWQTQELDFSRDREDWHERISEEERFQRLYGLAVDHERHCGPPGFAEPDESRAHAFTPPAAGSRTGAWRSSASV